MLNLLAHFFQIRRRNPDAAGVGAPNAAEAAPNMELDLYVRQVSTHERDKYERIIPLFFLVSHQSPNRSCVERN